LRQSLLNEGKRLKPMEEARTWQRIIKAKGWTITQLAHAIGRPKSTVSDRLAMLDAPAAFQPLFIDGTLGASAAPIVRQFADVPPKVAATIVERMQQNYEWKEDVRHGKTVPLKTVEGALNAVLSYPFVEVDEKVGYIGDTFVVKSKRYAVDSNDYWKHQQAQQRKDRPAATTTSVDWQKKNAEQVRRQAAANERKEKLRSAQVAAVAAKLPSELTGSWSLLLIDWMLSLVNDGANVAEIAGH
jgi:hypothetical protein